MKTILALVAVTILLASLLPAQDTAPVVVELFTSEGCSSCPPADAVLLALSRQPYLNGTPLILLGEHVDYWNYIGWTDRFSAKQFSQRQSDYARDFHLASVYTPQMVIDGQGQFVGNDRADVNHKIAAAAKVPKPAQVTVQWEGSSQLRINVQSGGTTRALLLLAVTEDGLSTHVGTGENDGQTLHHAAVVRELRELGSVDKSSFEITTHISRQPEWSPAELKIAVLLQDPGSGKILGAAQTTWQH